MSATIIVVVEVTDVVEVVVCVVVEVVEVVEAVVSMAVVRVVVGVVVVVVGVLKAEVDFVLGVEVVLDVTEDSEAAANPVEVNVVATVCGVHSSVIAVVRAFIVTISVVRVSDVDGMLSEIDSEVTDSVVVLTELYAAFSEVSFVISMSVEYAAISVVSVDGKLKLDEPVNTGLLEMIFSFSVVLLSMLLERVSASVNVVKSALKVTPVAFEVEPLDTVDPLFISVSDVKNFVEGASVSITKSVVLSEKRSVSPVASVF